MNVIILAAGKGTRMKSDKAKVLHTIHGVPMIRQILDTILPLSPTNIYVVVGHQAAEVKQCLADYSVTFVTQEEQLGTGHAVLQAHPHIEDHSIPSLILSGDTPLIQTDTLSQLIQSYESTQAKGALLTTSHPEPGAYGRIIRDENHQIKAIKEAKDCSVEELTITEINPAMYLFDTQILFNCLTSLTNNNAQNEYYLTDIVDYLYTNNHLITDINVSDHHELMGINTQEELDFASSLMAKL